LCGHVLKMWPSLAAIRAVVNSLVATHASINVIVVRVAHVVHLSLNAATVAPVL
jgi:hypothetical protein